MSRRTASLSLIPALFFLAVLAGCATPAVEVRSIVVEESGADAVRLGVDVDLTNPAAEPMRLLQWEYTCTAGGASYHGKWEALRSLPPGETVTERLPVIVPLPASAIDPATGWSVSGTLSFRSPSRIAEIFYDLRLWRPSVGFGGTARPAGASADAADATAASIASAAAPSTPPVR